MRPGTAGVSGLRRFHFFRASLPGPRIAARPSKEAPVRGLMQRDELVLTRILERAVTLYPRSQIVTRTPEGDHQESYEELGERVALLANALVELGVRPGDRVGTFAW